MMQTIATDHPYNRVFLEDTMELLGEAVEYASLKCGMDADTFMGAFISCGLADVLDRGAPYLLYRSGISIACKVLEESGLYNGPEWPKPIYDDISPEFWAGRLYVLYHWISGRRTSSVWSVLKIKAMVQMYEHLHTASIKEILDTVDAVVRSREPTCIAMRGPDRHS